MGLAATAEAASPPTPPGCGTAATRTVIDETDRPIPDDGAITPALEITGMGAHLADVDVQTSIAHTFAADLDVVLVSPAGTRATLTADNAGDLNDVFRGTLWDDDAGDANPPGPVTDNGFQNDVAESPLVPEEALGAFVGENPNGTWILRVQDDNSGDTGSLERWSIAVGTCSATPPGETGTVSQPAPQPLQDSAGVESTLAASGLGAYLMDLDVTTRLSHSFGGDLDVTLTSPAGTTVTLTTDNGGGADNAFNGTVWDDDGGDFNPPGPVTLSMFSDGVPESPLVPEEAMAAFIGENPNGTWRLRVEDDQAGDTGVLESWSLAARTEPFSASPDRTAPVVSGLAVRPRTFRRRSQVRYRLSEAAKVRFRVERALAGRRRGRRCAPLARGARKPARGDREAARGDRRAGRRNRNAGRRDGGARRCTRFVRLRDGLRHPGRAGWNRRRLTRRVGGRRLRAGAYRLAATATDGAGNRSATRYARFRVTRR
jgi:subtilisin-like proprotein convertase family protein